MIGGEELRTTRNRLGARAPTDRKQVDRLRTRLGMVFQSFNLWTHMTVLQNVIEAPVHVLGVSKREATAAALALLKKVGIAEKAGEYPAHLSGGQQQRAAIARDARRCCGCSTICCAADSESYTTLTRVGMIDASK